MSTEKGTQYFLNEIPQNTGLKEVEHSQISVSDVFPEKFCEIANSYIKKLEGVLYRYDVVIFMARKAICFYKALLLNTEITMPYKWEQRTPVRSILFNEYLGAAYVMIFAGIKCREYNGNSQIFVDSDGKTITRKNITLQCLHEKLKKYAIAKQNSVEGGRRTR